jgi:hypothetical protein
VGYIIDDPRAWRVSKSGMSIKTGWADEKKIVAKAPFVLPAPEGAMQEWLNNAERICEMHNAALSLRQHLEQALRDARQLQASLDDPSAEVPQDADVHRLRSTRAYQVVRGLERALGASETHSPSPGEGVPAPEQTGALLSSAGPSAPGSSTPFDWKGVAESYRDHVIALLAAGNEMRRALGEGAYSPKYHHPAIREWDDAVIEATRAGAPICILKDAEPSQSVNATADDEDRNDYHED